MVEEDKHYKLVSKTKKENPNKAVMIAELGKEGSWFRLTDQVEKYFEMFEVGAEYVVRFDLNMEDKYGNPFVAFMRKIDAAKPVEKEYKADEVDMSTKAFAKGLPKTNDDRAFLGMCMNQALSLVNEHYQISILDDLAIQEKYKELVRLLFKLNKELQQELL